MKVISQQIIDEYLTTLEAELADVSPSDRAEIILEVREHYEEARRALPNPTEAALRNILERLGPPAEIAAETRQRLGVTAPASGSYTVPQPTPSRSGLAVGPLEIAAVIGWIAWLPIGVLLMAISPRWTRRTKVITILAELLTLVLLFGASSTMFPRVFYLLLLLVPPTLIGIVGASYLTWKLSSSRRR